MSANPAGAGCLEPFGSASVGFHFRHGIRSLHCCRPYNEPENRVGIINDGTSGLRSNEHHELSPFHFWFLNNHTVFSQGVGNPVQGIQTDGLGIDNFATTEAHGHFDLVFLREELLDLANLEVEIVFFGLGPKLNLAGFNDGLLLFGFLLLLFQFIAELVEIHNSTDRRIRLIGNLDQIKPLFMGYF